jgi:hypothetical protein
MKKIFICCLYAAGVSVFNAQGKIDKAIENLEKNYGQEKVYILTDKDQYVVGDNIYFKSFVFNGYSRAESPTTLFVELYDHLKNLVDKRTIFLTNGEGDGTFNLTNALKEDVYYIRAYTTWMANFPEEFNYLKAVPIYNSGSEQKLVLDKNTKWTAGVFPEGGTFVNGLPSKVAIRIYSQGTPPASWNGYIIDSEKPSEKLVSFKGLDENVSSFSIIPKTGKIYKAIIEDDQGQKQTITLPKVSETGINIQANSNSEGIQFSIKSTGLTNGLQGYTIVGTINNQLAYKANIKANAPDASSKIPIKASDDINGILQLSVFDDKENLVAKRLCFIKPKNLSISQPDFVDISLNNQPRAFNSFDLHPDADYQHYTVLVRDVNNVPVNQNKDNILSSLWLTGDLTSRIFSPAQYFAKDGNADALDALMISEQWKRFDWNDLLSGKTPEVKYIPKSNLSFKGRITKNGIALPNTTVNLLFQSDNVQKGISQAQTDNNGYIYLDNLIFNEPLTVSYYLNKENTSDTDKLSMTFQTLNENIPYKGTLPASNYHLTADKTPVNPAVANALQNIANQKSIRNDEIQIEEVKLTAKKKDLTAELDKQLSSGRFSSFNATIFDFVNENQDAQTSLNVLQWLQGRAAGLTFTMDNSGNYIPSIRGSQAKLFLDEIPVDAGMINSIPISNIAMVKVLKNDGLAGNAVAVYTKRGNMGSNADEKKDSTNKTLLRGYDKAIEFEQPDITSDNYKKIIKDTRELLYWNPKLSDEPNVPPRAKFFNNDEAKNREIIIISFDKNDKILFYDEIK